MVRNWDLIRIILEKIEQDSFNDFILDKEYEKLDFLISLSEEEKRKIIFGHLEILIGAGILKHIEVMRNDEGDFVFWDFRGAYVTMEGHDLLDALRNKTVWKKVKELSKRSGISLSWEFIKAAIPIVISQTINGLK